MATRTIVETLSDLSGKEDAETVSFALDGATYEIDLTDTERKALDKALSRYVDNARKVSGGKGRKVAGKSSTGVAAAAIREWAAATGVDCPARGRIPAEVRTAYMARVAS